jgi:hypothetical protein
MLTDQGKLDAVKEMWRNFPTFKSNPDNDIAYNAEVKKEEEAKPWSTRNFDKVIKHTHDSFQKIDDHFLKTMPNNWQYVYRMNIAAIDQYQSAVKKLADYKKQHHLPDQPNTVDFEKQSKLDVYAGKFKKDHNNAWHFFRQETRDNDPELNKLVYQAHLARLAAEKLDKIIMNGFYKVSKIWFAQSVMNSGKPKTKANDTTSLGAT